MVFMPPRHGKSELISRYFPAWYLGCFPDNRVILTSYEADFAASWGRRARDLLEEHGTLFNVSVSQKSSAANRWDIEGRDGGMITAGVGGAITGRGAHVAIIDDPVKNRAEAESETIRQKTWEWYTSTLYTRLEPDGAVVLLMTRWHEDDLAGRLLAQQESRDAEWDGVPWEVISLPALAEHEDDALGRDGGQALWPGRYDEPRLKAIKSDVGTYDFNALYQQNPSPSEGGILKRYWWKYWHHPGVKPPPVTVKGANGEIILVHSEPLPEKFERMAQSWDMAFKDTKHSSYVVGQVWGKVGADKYLLDQVRDQMDFPATITAVKAVTTKWPRTPAKWVEDKANGPAVIASLKSKISGLIPVSPDVSKEARAHAVSPQLEAGNVYIPHPSIALWVEGFIAECGSFPNATHDDQVDAMTQALSKFEGGKDLSGISLGANAALSRTSPNVI